jgi:hypothetical protein
MEKKTPSRASSRRRSQPANEQAEDMEEGT